MTSFVNDSGEYLDYSGDDVSLTKQSLSLFSFQIKGDFSQNFTIDNNSYNRGVLGYYSAMQVDNPAFSKNSFTLVRNGNNVMRGFVVITEVTDTINCFFISGNSNWFNDMQVNLKDLDWESLTVLWSAFASYYSVTSGICFPDVDWGYNGLKRGDEISYYIFTERANQTGEVPDSKLSDQYPCIFLHSIITKLAAGTGVKIEGNLLDDKIYNSLLITPNGPDLKWPTTQTEPFREFATVGSNFDLTNNDPIVFDNIVSEGSLVDYDETTGVYTSRKTATYRITLDITFTATDTYELYLYKNGATSTVIFPDTLGSHTLYQGVFYLNLAKGDYFDVRVQSIGVTRTVSAGSSLLVEIHEKIEPVSFYSNATGLGGAIANYVSASGIVPNMKGIDLIKFLVNYFNCICDFDLETNTITLTKLNSVTDVEDWSAYYVSHKEGYNRGLGANNYIEVPETTEPDIVRYNEVNDVPYGGGNITTDYNSKRDNTLYKLPFGPAYDQQNRTYLGWNKPFIEFFRPSDEMDISIEYTGVSSSGGAARFAHTGTAEATNRRLYRIVSNIGTYSGFAVNNAGLTGSPTYSEFYGVDFLTDDTGRIIPQSVDRISGPHRILFAIPGADASDSGGPATTVMTAFFDKPKYNETIDEISVSLAISNIEGREFNATIGELYHQKLKAGFNSPVINASMVLPESVFANYNFRKFVRLETKDLVGTFWVGKIGPYRNAMNEVGVELIFMG